MSEENEQNEKDKRIKIGDLPVSETELTDEEEQSIGGGRMQPSPDFGQPSPEARSGQPSPGDFGQPSPEAS